MDSAILFIVHLSMNYWCLQSHTMPLNGEELVPSGKSSFFIVGDVAKGLSET